MGLMVFPVLESITWLQSGSSGVWGTSFPAKRDANSSSEGEQADLRLTLDTRFVCDFFSSLAACSIRCSPSHLLLCGLSVIVLRNVIIPQQVLSLLLSYHFPFKFLYSCFVANKRFHASAMHGAKLRKRSEQTKKTARKLAGLKKKPVKDCLFYMICGKKCFNLHRERNVPPGQEGPAMWHGSLATYPHEKSNSLVPHHPT